MKTLVSGAWSAETRAAGPLVRWTLPVAGHRTAAVEDELHGHGWTHGPAVAGGSGEVEHERQLVVGLESDDVDVEVRGQVHGEGSRPTVAV